MITGELKNKIDKIWETFWTGGITNPLTVIEQFTYLLFIKGLDEVETTKEQEAEFLGMEYEGLFPKDKQHLRWNKFKQLGSPEEMYEVVSKEVFPFIKNLHGKEDSAYSKYMSDAMFMIPTANMLAKIVDGIDNIPMKDRDTKGDLYEYLLSKVATSGTNGQFRTPRHIIDMMVELMRPTPEDIIIDPAMGSAGFLVSAGEYLRKNHSDLFLVQGLKEHFNNNMFYGNDMDRTMLRIGAMNMMLHGVENPNIEYRDSLSEMNKDKDKYTLVLANPPFKGSLDYEAVSNDLLKITKTKKTELLFLALFIRILKAGGRAAVIVPDGVLFGSSNAHKQIRKEIIENHKLEAIISMPSGVFKPYAGVSTAIVIFTKTGAGGTDNVWFYDMKADGYSLDDKRNPIEENDIPDIINRFNNLEAEKERKRTEQSFFVPVDELRENDYDLSINKYKEIEYEEVEYEKPEIILSKVNMLESEIIKGIQELEELLRDKR
ncbi:type I restriction-modification system subunit M [Aneurinibacillus danicus]|uniref:site-specific DNA-methyltransferase (adenine-specific) n=1 Tax=Aneurinibacillus danicus TaxID=267746 RepID=A0A511VG71_9BACL|nr:class I SAM-dependent DNA methyltransferase [Aneurinibacillus danicus]GEN36222.1 DNA methyltransferase [Aneurinibacillus danicus]